MTKAILTLFTLASARLQFTFSPFAGSKYKDTVEGRVQASRLSCQPTSITTCMADVPHTEILCYLRMDHEKCAPVEMIDG